MSTEKKPGDQLRKLFIGGLTRNTTEGMTRACFEQWGNITDCTVMRDNAGASRCFGFVIFESSDSVDNLLAAKKDCNEVFTVDGRNVEVKRALPRVEGGSVTAQQLKSGKIFVGGLSSTTTEDHLQEYFSKFGKILEIELLRDKSNGRLRGFGFVTFDDEDVADKACQLREHVINLKTCEVKKAQPRGSSSKQPSQRRDNNRSEHIQPQQRFDYPQQNRPFQDFNNQQQNQTQMLLTQLISHLAAGQGMNQMQEPQSNSFSSFPSALSQSYQPPPQVQQHVPAMQQQPQNPLAALGLNNLNVNNLDGNNLLLASLLNNNRNTNNPSALGLNNLNLLSLIAGQNSTGGHNQLSGGYNNDNGNGPSSSQGTIIRDYANTSNGNVSTEHSSYGNTDNYSSSYDSQSQSGYGPMKYQGQGNKNYRPY